MTHRIILLALTIFCAAWLFADDKTSDLPEKRLVHAATDSEARSRALLLHEMASGTLQMMHRDFFDDDNAHAIPSASLEDVFQEIEKGFSVQMKWLTVNTDVVNVDHQAKTEFEKFAVTSLAAGKPFVELVTSEHYQFAGPIRLGSQCLKCHVKLRTSNEDRTAGLVITMPISTTNSSR
jgi:hypothetical protein